MVQQNSNKTQQDTMNADIKVRIRIQKDTLGQQDITAETNSQMQQDKK